MHHQPAFAAIILCGGKSSRMGRSKADLNLNGETLLARTIRTLSTVAWPIVVVGAAESDGSELRFAGEERPAFEFVRDALPDRGPLEGLAAGFRAISGRAQQAFVCGCDMPLLSAAFAQRMMSLLGDFDAAATMVAEQLHPLAAAYRVSILPTITARLAADQRSLHGLLTAIRARHVSPDDLTDIDPQLASLRNVNSPQQWQQLLDELNARQGGQQQ